MLLLSQVAGEVAAKNEAEAACQHMEGLMERLSEDITKERAEMVKKVEGLKAELQQAHKSLMECEAECDRKLAAASELSALN